MKKIKRKMKKIKRNLSLLSIICLLAISCSDDTDTNFKADDLSGTISNEDMTLTYGKSLLNGNIALKNSRLSFDRLVEGRAMALTRSLSVTSSYQTPDLTGATKLTGNGVVEIKDNKVFYIPERETFSGSINFNASGKLIILGTYNGAQVNVPDGGIVEVAPGANASNIHLNTKSTLNNYGSVVYSSGSVNGKINNYSELTFKGTTNINGSSEINNFCGLTFEGSTQINQTVNNNAYINFEEGFHINGSGALNLAAGSLTNITGGTISVDGKIKNESQYFARIDIDNNVTIGNMNATPAFVGKIDINTDKEIAESKIDKQVSVNANTYIAAKNCRPERGIRPCDGSALQFTLAATVSSPMVGDNINLSATDVRILNGRAYVSYHTNDEFYDNTPNGALRIFDIQNHTAPSLISEAIFNKVEFNGIDIASDKLYAVGGDKDGARLVETKLSDGTFITGDLSYFQTHKIPGVAAKNSFIYNNMLWLVSGGANGGFFKLDPSSINYDVSETLYADGARSKYTVHNNRVQAFLAIEEGGAYLRISNIDGSNVKEYRYSTLIQKINTGKNTMAIDDNYVYLALSDRGLAKIELATGKLIDEFKPNTYRIAAESPKVFKENGLTNGVAVNDCFVFLANGADGVIVLEKDNFNVVGSFKLAESANYVYVKDGLLFVATGRNGLNIIKIN